MNHRIANEFPLPILINYHFIKRFAHSEEQRLGNEVHIFFAFHELRGHFTVIGIRAGNYQEIWNIFPFAHYGHFLGVFVKKKIAFGNMNLQAVQKRFSSRVSL